MSALDIPVSVVVRRTPLRGHEAEFEDALRELLALLERWPGHTGTGVVRPAAGHREYTVLARFASADAAAAWEHSPQRQRWLETMTPLNDTFSPLTLQSGLEFWFTPPDQPPAAQPPRWKVILLSICALYPVSLIINIVVMPHFAAAPLWLRVLISACLVVPIMLGLVLPYLNRVFASWLFAGR